jgi:hypothetical protein
LPPASFEFYRQPAAIGPQVFDALTAGWTQDKIRPPSR